MKYQYAKSCVLLLSLLCICFPARTKAAEEIAFVSGAFRRTISIENVEHLAKTGKAKGLLEDVLRFSNQDPQKISLFLNEKFDLPLVLTSKLMYSSIGNAIINRVAQIIYPIKVPDKAVSIPAIRAGVINGILIGNGELSLVQFLKSYPNKVIAINLPALFQITNKVESMTDLVKFFSSSPLERLKERKP